MLVLQMNHKEDICIGDNIRLSLATGGRRRIGIQAPEDCVIRRVPKEQGDSQHGTKDKDDEKGA